ncbi:MAG: chorismate mutase [Acidimicrobiaceae bacterium]|nr:chorismate mutase [Acidimicrobiaceae bacterium]
MNTQDHLLADYRRNIDDINRELVSLLAKRFEITRALSEHKNRVGLPARHRKREEEQIVQLQKLAEEVGVDRLFLKRFMQLIYDEVVHQNEVDKKLPAQN